MLQKPIQSRLSQLQVNSDLQPVNERLKEYVEAWDSFVDAWLVIKVADPAFVFRWRQQAERVMKAAGKGAMTDRQVGKILKFSTPDSRVVIFP